MQIASLFNAGNIVYRARGASDTEWSEWRKLTRDNQILNTATAIEASTSDDNIVGAKGLKEYINSNKNITYTASPNSSGYAEISNIDVSKFSYFVAVNVVVGNAGSKGIGRMVFAKSDDVWFYKATASTYSGNANELTSSISPMYNNLIKIGCNANATIICSIESGF